jgi:hypothetical protein
LAHTKQPSSARPKAGLASRRSGSRPRKTSAKVRLPGNNNRATAQPHQLLTNGVLRPIVDKKWNIESGSLQPKPSGHTQGKGRDALIIRDDVFIPRTRAEAEEFLKQTEKRVQELEKKGDLTADERDFVTLYRDTFGPHHSKAVTPHPTSKAPLSREQVIKNFVETEKALALMRKALAEDKTPLTPADIDDDSWVQDLERRLGRKFAFRSESKPS